MTRYELDKVIRHLDTHGHYVFHVNDLRRWFIDEPLKTFRNALARHVKLGFLAHPCRSVYVNVNAHSKDAYILEHIAKVLRKGEYTYISLESLLSEAGVISQVPMQHLTVMTTGRSQTFKTPYGVIEMTHTQRSIPDILQNIVKAQGRPLRLAKIPAAYRDLKMVGRNLHMIDEEVLHEYE